MGGFRQHIDDVEVKNIWPELLPKDMMEIRNANQSDLTLGLIARSTAAERLGLNFETEQKKRQEEEKQYPQQSQQAGEGDRQVAQVAAKEQGQQSQGQEGQQQEVGENQPVGAEEGYEG
jgi:hypothetical protein